MNAQGAYKTLTAIREKLGSLSGEEEDKLLQAEKSLGQKLAFDMDAAKGGAKADEPAPASNTRPEWGKRGLGEQGDMMLPGGQEKGGQMTLLSSPKILKTAEIKLAGRTRKR